jgi:hypothetical protein
MVSIGLAILRTRFPPVEQIWEFTPLSHEPGAICTWEAGESGRGVIRPKRIYFPKHFCYCFSPNLCVLNTTNTD